MQHGELYGVSMTTLPRAWCFIVRRTEWRLTSSTFSRQRPQGRQSSLGIWWQLVVVGFTPLMGNCEVEKPIHRQPAVPGKAEVEEILAAMKEHASSAAEPIAHIVNIRSQLGSSETNCSRCQEDQITYCKIINLYPCRLAISGANRQSNGDPHWSVDIEPQRTGIKGNSTCCPCKILSICKTETVLHRNVATLLSLHSFPVT